jgi:hypothetical protein
MDKKHDVMRLFFIWLGLLTLLPVGNLGVQIAQVEGLPNSLTVNANVLYYIICAVNMVFSMYMLFFYSRVFIEMLAEAAKPIWKRKQNA